MTDITWLSSEAIRVHSIFYSMFYALVTVFLLIGVFVEYFKWPLGGMPSFSSLIGRALVAAILLHSYPEVTNIIGDVTDAISTKLGDLNQFKIVLSRMGDSLHQFTWSWVSVRDSVTMLLSFVTFFLLYFSVHVAEALLLYTWTLLYVTSPLLIALYVLPATAAATTALYRSLIEACCWKIMWSIIATLVWSAALSDINKPGHDISFISAICFNLILAGSLLTTPMVVHALAGAGVSSLAKTVSGIAVGGTMIGPAKVAKAVSMVAGKSYGKAAPILSNAYEKLSAHRQKPTMYDGVTGSKIIKENTNK
jgi:hypothetical protein